MSSLERRIEKLEDGGEKRLIVMWRYDTETDEQAEERWLSAHPGETLKETDDRVIIIEWERVH